LRFEVLSENPDIRQEADSPAARHEVTMQQVNIMTASLNALSFRRNVIHAAFTILISLLAGWFQCGNAHAETTSSALHTTLIVFADHRMPDEEWTDLFAALRRARAEIAAATPAVAGEAEIVRGDQIRPGLRVNAVISIFLHGDCTLMPRPRLVVQGALGWVPRSKGFIEPFVNVNCTRLVDMLGPMALGMDRSRRDIVMAEAMARVILHEWVHIATQSARHESHGVTQSEFGVQDLLADDAEVGLRRNRKRI
jgi:hypothetical protein